MREPRKSADRRGRRFWPAPNRLPGPFAPGRSAGTLVTTPQAASAPCAATNGFVEEEEWESENLTHVVWRLAWPAVLTTMLQFINGLVDMFFVGQLGPAAQAAVGMGGQVVMLLMAASMAVTTGATA